MSRRKRVSMRSMSRSTGSELLGELDPVPVGVVDVEEAHLARQLEHDPDFDACVAQPLRLSLEVADVDVRDAVVRQFALREPYLHLAATQRRPALLEVDGGLLEAEHLPVEATPLGEVANPVPDGRRHTRS